MLAKLRAFLDEHLDPAAIDRNADIPRPVIDGLARLGVFGMTAPLDSLYPVLAQLPEALRERVMAQVQTLTVPAFVTDAALLIR